jgi:hypothetical protein
MFQIFLNIFSGGPKMTFLRKVVKIDGFADIDETRVS